LAVRAVDSIPMAGLEVPPRKDDDATRVERGKRWQTKKKTADVLFLPRTFDASQWAIWRRELDWERFTKRQTPDDLLQRPPTSGPSKLSRS
jgi:hypothetical protein